ncbi:MAG: hypothetical protein AVDCRST_MAG76-2927 [uncultured Acidimicrobiales bacterium]|uniref:Uncharacterized protein n=1 Tax=uncultured Acidimicrobiales bacterium TaxID=310071 RepID=A0A6J4IZQ8_9ACTN|nr:MAG: hypothetical protein AVDCRST_MAG76-2927 [uncultured Acidimicrobiales bacterium]
MRIDFMSLDGVVQASGVPEEAIVTLARSRP